MRQNERGGPGQGLVTAMGIRVKLIVLIVVVVIITASIATLVAHDVSNANVEKQISKHLITAAQAKAEHIQTFLEQRLDSVELFAEQARAFELLLGDLTLPDTFPAMTSNIMSEMAASQSTIDTVLLLDDRGSILGSSDLDRFPVGMSLAHLPAFQQGHESTYIGAADFGESDSTFELCTAAPFTMNSRHGGTGIIVQLGGAGELLEITADTTGLGDTGTVYLVDGEGYMIRLAGDAILRQKINLEGQEEKTTHIVDIGAQTPESRAMLYTNYAGTRVFGIHAKLPDVGWTVVAEIGSNEAFAPVRRQSEMMIAIFVGTLLVGIALAVLLSRTISKPIVRLHQGVDQIIRGNLDYTVGIQSKDEIGQLSRAFDEMTALLKASKARLEEYSTALEQKVKERTSALSEANHELEREVTERRRIEEELRAKNQELETVENEQRSLLAALEEQNRIISAAHMDLATALEAATLSQEKLQAKNEELLAVQAELREINQHLEDIVEQRTSEIRRLLAQKEEFISQLGHDLRSPLTPLVALVPMLREHGWDPEIERVIDVVSRNVTYMKNLVEKTLMLASISSTEANLNIRNVNLQRILRELLRRKQYEELNAGIEVVNRVTADHLVRADELRLAEVLDNLASNAVKFMPDGGTLGFDAWEEEGFVTVAVSDTGIGLSPEQAEHVFDEFYKADEARGDLGSVGLGLSICARIVEQHGGRIWVESDGLGQGTTFYFTIPSAADSSRASGEGGEHVLPIHS